MPRVSHLKLLLLFMVSNQPYYDFRSPLRLEQDIAFVLLLSTLPRLCHYGGVIDSSPAKDFFCSASLP
jgi:hypothetical protein